MKQAYRPVKGRQFRHSGMISHNGFSVFNAANFHVEPPQPSTNRKINSPTFSPPPKT
jgi:hypothetical protein